MGASIGFWAIPKLTTNLRLSQFSGAFETLKNYETIPIACTRSYSDKILALAIKQIWS
ncbi:hypothetical protein BJY01DRAFT_225592 [Aspergillus pseudoustus]|uniref:Uncharacterized protein n=1 Tax=Aspergillus pseudoustus TaxID=1810923 RepID=A0ABR4J1Y2_9EURO